ncbi:hypothetical protein K438DRAFT_1787741 [Mycena galopus ATCC 62051]|nr:hypothetical protein K438DRAFT_1787741 [Mycena galopus ATCC 62051]
MQHGCGCKQVRISQQQSRVSDQKHVGRPWAVCNPTCKLSLGTTSDSLPNAILDLQNFIQSTKANNGNKWLPGRRIDRSCSNVRRRGGDDGDVPCSVKNRRVIETEVRDGVQNTGMLGATPPPFTGKSRDDRRRRERAAGDGAGSRGRPELNEVIEVTGNVEAGPLRPGVATHHPRWLRSAPRFALVKALYFLPNMNHVTVSSAGLVLVLFVSRPLLNDWRGNISGTRSVHQGGLFEFICSGPLPVKQHYLTAGGNVRERTPISRSRYIQAL